MLATKRTALAVFAAFETFAAAGAAVGRMARGRETEPRLGSAGDRAGQFHVAAILPDAADILVVGLAVLLALVARADSGTALIRTDTGVSDVHASELIALDLRYLTALGHGGVGPGNHREP